MPAIVIEQALFVRPSQGVPQLRRRSPGVADAWLPQLEQMLIDFGERPAGIACPGALFAQPLGKQTVAVVQVADQPVEGQVPLLGFRVLLLARKEYDTYLGEPFALADRFPPQWSQESQLAALEMPAEPLPPRTVEQIRQVLRQIKAGALREDEDPDNLERTVENSDSPALLGGVQVLVDGGYVVFERPAPAPDVIRGLWLLLPAATRFALWPATFAFGNALHFDALVVPRRGNDDYTSYTTEEQAADYPQGRYELSLQVAAETGDQRMLDELLGRRSSREILRMGVVLVLFLSAALLLFRWFAPQPRTPQVELSPEQRERMANSAAMVSCQNPWTALGLSRADEYRRRERAATAAGMVACRDPWSALGQMQAAQGRYVEIWKK